MQTFKKEASFASKYKRSLQTFLILIAMVFAGSSTVHAGDTWQTPTPGLFRGNLHMHTTCSDGRGTYEEMVKEALRLKMSFVAVTDHTFGGSSLCDEVIEQCRNEKRLLCIPGMEVTGKVHLLAIGIQTSINKRLPVRKQVEAIHKQGGLAIAAHPFRINNAYSDGEIFASGLDAVECRGIPPEQEAAFLARLRNHSIPCVYNSDAHSISEMTQDWNTCVVSIGSFEDLRAAIKAGHCMHRKK